MVCGKETFLRQEGREEVCQEGQEKEGPQNFIHDVMHGLAWDASRC